MGRVLAVIAVRAFLLVGGVDLLIYGIRSGNPWLNGGGTLCLSLCMGLSPLSWVLASKIVNQRP